MGRNANRDWGRLTRLGRRGRARTVEDPTDPRSRRNAGVETRALEVGEGLSFDEFDRYTVQSSSAGGVAASGVWASKAGDFTADFGEAGRYMVDSSSAPLTVTLPTAATAQAVAVEFGAADILLKRANTGANVITVLGDANIDGAATFVDLVAQWSAAWFSWSIPDQEWRVF